MHAHLVGANDALLSTWWLAFNLQKGAAYYAGTLKMQKVPPSMRFLACSHDCPSSYLCDVFTAIFHLLGSTFADVWRAKVPFSQPWYCLSSAAVMGMVHSYNAECFPASNRPTDLPQAYDFQRLYTNIPHDLLRTAMARLFVMCTQHVNPWGVRVVSTPFKDPGGRATHVAYFKYSAPSRPVGDHQGGSTTRYFSPADLTALFACLLSTTYIRFAHVLVQQTCGIPMGISPAPFIANLFLGYYGLEFLRQDAATTRQHDTLQSFAFCKRYLDDLLALRCPHLCHLLYTDQTYRGLHGIYLFCLAVTPQRHPHLPPAHMPFLDILLVHGQRPTRPPHNGAGRRRRSHAMSSFITTRLYDKRAQPAFNGVRLSRYVPRHSNVNDPAKDNILASQFHRLRRVITEPSNFCASMADVISTLARSGYARGALAHRYRRLMAARPELFFHQRQHSPALDLFADTWSQVRPGSRST